MPTSFEIARTVLVDPARLAGWLDRFRSRHGELQLTATADAAELAAANGARARLLNRWEPLPDPVDEQSLCAHFGLDRTIALLLVRKGANAVAIARGSELLVHRVSRHYVQGRTKAGGWSQQRYARRRDNQASKAYQDAADDAFEVLIPQLDAATALVTGGDRAGLAAVLADPRLAGLAGLPQRHPVLPVPDARLRVLTEAAISARQVPIELNALAVSASAAPTGPEPTDQEPTGQEPTGQKPTESASADPAND